MVFRLDQHKQAERSAVDHPSEQTKKALRKGLKALSVLVGSICLSVCGSFINIVYHEITVWPWALISILFSIVVGVLYYRIEAKAFGLR